jgi:hypothetical protein
MPSRNEIDDVPHHLHTIAILALEVNRSVEVVSEIFLTELARLKEGARIDDFLVVLTCRKVRDAVGALARSGV